MLVKCIFNSGKSLPNDSRCLGETDETDYSFLELGNEYIVYGLMFLSNRTDYLICPTNGNPIWIPANLCEIKDSNLPVNWSICVTRLNDDYKILYDDFKIQSLIGYSELVTSISHYIGLIERKVGDLKIFLCEKNRIDNELVHMK